MPSVRINEKNYTSTVGERVVLKCSVSTLPCVLPVSWEYRSSDEQIRQLDTGDPKYEGSNENYPSLVINDVRKEDEGRYTCTVSRCMGRERASTKLTVNEDIPIVKIREESYTAVAGDKVTLECSVTSRTPIRSVFWRCVTPEGETVTLDIDQRKYLGSQLDDPQLVITSVSKDDEGEYFCCISNVCAEKKSEHTKLRVEGGLPQLVMKESEHTQTERLTAILLCNVQGIPPALRIRWKKGKREIPIDNNKYISGSLQSPSLVIPCIEYGRDDGIYTCEAENLAGTESESVKLTIRKPEHAIGHTDNGQDLSIKEQNEFDDHRKSTIPENVNTEQIVYRHSQMVNSLSENVFPRQKEKWVQFIELLKAYLTPRELFESESLQDIVDNLMRKKHITYGSYQKLHKVVRDIDPNTARIIEKAESEIEMMKNGGVPGETEVKIECLYIGEYKSDEQMRLYISEVEKKCPEMKYRLVGRGHKGSIALTFTIKAAPTPKHQSALFLADKLRASLQNKNIVLKDEAGQPLNPQAEPTLKIPKEDKPTMRLSKGHYQFIRGQTAILESVVITSSEIEYIKWFRLEDGKTNEITIDNEKYFGGLKSPSIVIGEAKKTDSGLYLCRARNRAGETESNTAFVDIFSSEPDDETYPPSGDDPEPDHNPFYPRLCRVKWPNAASYGFDLDENREDTGHYVKTVNEDSPAETACLKTGDRIVEVNGVNVESDSLQELIRKVKSGEETKLLVVDPDTDGFYKSRGIKVTSGLQEVRHYRSDQSPFIKIVKESYTAIVGEQVKLECSVSAFPPIRSASWQRILHDGKTVTLDIDQRKYSGSRVDDPHLVITSVSKDDEGDYLCSVSNVCGVRTSAPTKLTVEGDIPVVEILESSHTSVIGDQVKMECSISAIPPIISVSWQHRSLRGRTVKLCFDQERYVGGKPNDPSLVIHEVNKEDEGEYVCTASNLCGEQPSAPSYLTVNGGLPQLSIPSDEHSITEGDPAVLQCSVKANPPALAIKWSKMGRGGEIAIDNSKYILGSLESPSLIITNTEKITDEGLYTCEAENKAGSQDASVQLTIQTKTANNTPEQRTTIPEDAIAKEQIERLVKFVHAKMVNGLSGKISPELENWPKFIECFKEVLEPVDLQEGFHEIVQRLMSKMEIDHGHYKVLSEAVKEVDEQATLVIRKAETVIKTIREGGRPYEVPSEIKCKYDGDYFAPSSVQRSTHEITEMFPGFSNRITGEGHFGSIVLTLDNAKTPKQLSALFLGDMLRTKLHNGQIVLKDESGKPLVLQSSPEIRALTDDPTDMPTLRFSKTHYQFNQKQAGILECTVVAKPEVEYIKWFRVKDEKNEEIAIDNSKYFGELKLPKLVISSLGSEDQGIYFCRAGHQAGEAESNAAFVEIFSIDDTIMVNKVEEPRGARTVYLEFRVPDDATSVQSTVNVRLSQTGTYFCAICFTWSFMGLQEFSNGKKVIIFSVWDNKKNNDPESAKQAKIMHRCDNLDITRFGGQGTGLRCYLPYNWLLNEDVIFRVDAEQDRPWTAYAGHYFDKRTNKWHHIATIKTITNGSLIGSCKAFVNDFTRDGRGFRQKRKAVFSNVQYSVQGKWIECKKATFNADKDKHVRNINAGSEGKGRMFLETGGDVCNSNTLLDGTVSAE